MDNRQLHCGRPENGEGRAPEEMRTYDLLESLGIPYDRVDHEAAFTMEACLYIDRALGTRMCKNLMLCNRQMTRFYLLMMPGDKPFRTKELSAQIGSARLSFAPEEKMVAYLGVHPGSVTVLGLMNDPDGIVELLVDREVLEDETLGCHPCVNTSSIRMRTRDLLEVFLPAVRHVPRFVELGKPAKA